MVLSFLAALVIGTIKILFGFDYSLFHLFANIHIFAATEVSLERFLLLNIAVLRTPHFLEFA